MTRDWLVCANCAGPVSEGRCPVCRASRQRMQRENGGFSLSPTVILWLIGLLAAITAVLYLEHQTA
ncbi:hypothetical protein G5C51_28945 [Streptomyces sp. A7024]|uniref:Uncharacterized protein n=1 Tax=Streptomyces coryli TaxID=1128680 RepID=A0A6G4U7D8_9ACTN|nr:hypothetical protein [Streptomyces coryli]NGN67912.1 hypothetical protein [Streptomyces coryli]